MAIYNEKLKPLSDQEVDKIINKIKNKIIITCSNTPSQANLPENFGCECLTCPIISYICCG